MMRKPWLNRFVGAHTLSGTSAFRLVSALDLQHDRRVVVVIACPGTDPVLAGRALDRVHLAHRDPAHAVIARADERVSDASGDYVVLDFPARLDLADVVHLAADAGVKCEHTAADGFSATLRAALLAAAERRDPDTGGPQCIGTFALSNVLFSASGQHVLVGYGHNVVCHDEHGRLVPRGRFYQAPEIVAGAPATASSDFVGMLRMSRSVMAFVRVPDVILRILRGDTLPEDVELTTLLARFEIGATQAAPNARLPIPEILALSQQIRVALGSSLDVDGFRELVARLVRERRPDLASAGLTLRLAHAATWLELEGVRTPLTPLQGRLIGSLARARLERPGEVVTGHDMLVACWPDEQMTHASGRNRLYVAINSIRRQGLSDILVSVDGGYRLEPSVRVELADD